MAQNVNLETLKSLLPRDYFKKLPSPSHLDIMTKQEREDLLRFQKQMLNPGITEEDLIKWITKSTTATNDEGSKKEKYSMDKVLDYSGYKDKKEQEEKELFLWLSDRMKEFVEFLDDNVTADHYCHYNNILMTSLARMGDYKLYEDMEKRKHD